MSDNQKTDRNLTFVQRSQHAQYNQEKNQGFFCKYIFSTIYLAELYVFLNCYKSLYFLIFLSKCTCNYESEVSMS